jgi:LysM repeat protein
MIKLIIPLILLSVGISNATVRKDSIGVEKLAGKYYILHRVEPKETLFSLSRRYQVAVDDILASNPDAKEGLKIASVVKIPAAYKQMNTPDGRKHVVQPSETLFSIAKKYNVDIDRIVSVNHLQNHNLKIGQELLIPGSVQASSPTSTSDSKVYHSVSSGETLFSLSRTYQVDVDQIKKWNNLTDNNLRLGQMIVVGERSRAGVTDAIVANPVSEQKVIIPEQPEKVTTVDPPVNNTVVSSAPAVVEDVKKYRIDDNEYIRNKPSASDQTKLDKVVESGFAELIEGSDDTKKYLALHKTAPVGTIMQVKNEMNDLSVFVRIIGRLPSTHDNERINIRLSKIAYDHLGAIDVRFPVQISYIPR